MFLPMLLLLLHLHLHLLLLLLVLPAPPAPAPAPPAPPEQRLRTTGKRHGRQRGCERTVFCAVRIATMLASNTASAFSCASRCSVDRSSSAIAAAASAPASSPSAAAASPAAPVLAFLFCLACHVTDPGQFSAHCSRNTAPPRHEVHSPVHRCSHLLLLLALGSTLGRLDLLLHLAVLSCLLKLLLRERLLVVPLHPAPCGRLALSVGTSGDGGRERRGARAGAIGQEGRRRDGTGEGDEGARIGRSREVR